MLTPLIKRVLIIFFALAIITYMYLSSLEQIPINILYDNKPYKIKPQETHIIKKDVGNLSIYDSLRSEKLSAGENVLTIAEDPVKLNDADSIDQIINNLIDETDLKDYKGIKIILIDDPEQIIPVIQSGNVSDSYILDLGLYQTMDKAEQAFKNIKGRHESLFGNLEHKISPIEFNSKILFNLTLTQVRGFNLATQICDKLAKEKHECLVVHLPKSIFN